MLLLAFSFFFFSVFFFDILVGPLRVKRVLDLDMPMEMASLLHVNIPLL
jgi:hypothetical protein